ncbi:hypothetical protein [Sanguibacter sp. Z1732]|uniref:hypothetical protein n=1 Tax=Sanguibacter sp. Z1732 TaxID=3435412 RepID=UPI003D9CA513
MVARAGVTLLLGAVGPQFGDLAARALPGGQSLDLVRFVELVRGAAEQQVGDLDRVALGPYGDSGAGAVPEQAQVGIEGALHQLPHLRTGAVGERSQLSGRVRFGASRVRGPGVGRSGACRFGSGAPLPGFRRCAQPGCRRRRPLGGHPPPDQACRVPAHHRSVRNVLGDHGAGGDDALVPDVDAVQQHRV